MRLFKLLKALVVVAAVLSLGGESRAETSYFRNLFDQKVTFLSDGCYSVCLLLGVGDKYTDFESQKIFLKEKGILPLRLTDLRPDLPLRKGTAAYMFCRALEIKGGAVMRVLGPSEKYALRELIFLDLVKDGPSRKIVSGKELLSILLRASEYKSKKG